MIFGAFRLAIRALARNKLRASLTVLGAPDLIVLTLSEFAQQALRINRAGELPLMVDADHGYGNALNVQRTVQELETAGVACLTIEDTVLPRPYGPSGKPTLHSLDEGVGKMKAALSGRQDKTLTVAGRTSAFKTTSVKDGVARIKAYEKAGVEPAKNIPELVETSAKLTKDLGGPYGIGVRGSRSWASIHPGFLSGYSNYGQRDLTVTDGKLSAAMNTPESKAYNKLFVEMIQNSGPKNWSTYTWYQVGTDLGAWEAAGATWCLTGFENDPREAALREAIAAGPRP